MALSPDQLNEIDRWILDYLGTENRATPHLLRLLYNEEMVTENENENEAADEETISRQWMSNRIRRLSEHGHITRVHPDDAVYEFVNDPRSKKQ